MFLYSFSALLLWINIICAVPAPQVEETRCLQAGVPFFRKDYNFMKSVNTFYKEHNAAVKWTDAVATCRAEGAALGVPWSETEAVTLTGQFSPDTDVVWVGLHDLYSEGNFMTFNGSSISQAYVNWKRGEPDDHNGEDCVTIDKDGGYSDVSCDLKNRFICTKENRNISCDGLCPTYDTNYNYSFNHNRCYKLHTVPKSWHDAFKTCKSELADLTELNSESEAFLLVEELEQHPVASLRGNFNKTLVHVDFNDLIIPGAYMTHSGKSLKEAGYYEWAPGQPDNVRGEEHCGSMLRNGKLNDVNCQEKAMFFCEMVSSL